MRTDTPCRRHGYDTSGRYHVPVVKDGPSVVKDSPDDMCPDCRSAPDMPHAAECANTISWVCNDCGQDRYGPPFGIATWHEGRCDICGETTSVTEPRDFGGYSRFPPKLDDDEEGIKATGNPFPHALYAMMAEAKSCPECGTVTDIEYKDEGATNPLLDHMERTFNSCMDIAMAKNHDYAADADPFRNFRECGRFGVGMDAGILVRMSDKWSRLCQLAGPEAYAKMDDETLIDTLLDLINYAAILIAVYEDEG